ncbi:hypothetical protein [Actinoallomurus acanthiterrae]
MALRRLDALRLGEQTPQDLTAVVPMRQYLLQPIRIGGVRPLSEDVPQLRDDGLSDVRILDVKPFSPPSRRITVRFPQLAHGVTEISREFLSLACLRPDGHLHYPGRGRSSGMSAVGPIPGRADATE